jgi:hypothetical protein
MNGIGISIIPRSWAIGRKRKSVLKHYRGNEPSIWKTRTTWAFGPLRLHFYTNLSKWEIIR